MTQLKSYRSGKTDDLAEGVGFEPTRDFHPCRFSSSTEYSPPLSKPSNPVPQSVCQKAYFAPTYTPLVVKVVVRIPSADSA